MKGTPPKKYRCILSSMITWVLIPLWCYLREPPNRTLLKNFVAGLGFSLVLTTYLFWRKCNRESVSYYADHFLAFLLVLLLNLKWHSPRYLLLVSFPYLASYYYHHRGSFFMSMVLWLIFRAMIFWHFLYALAPKHLTRATLFYYNLLYFLHAVILLKFLPKNIKSEYLYSFLFSVFFVAAAQILFIISRRLNL